MSHRLAVANLHDSLRALKLVEPRNVRGWFDRMAVDPLMPRKVLLWQKLRLGLRALRASKS